MYNKPKKIINKKENIKLLNQSTLKISLITAIIQLILFALSGDRLAMSSAACSLILFLNQKYTVDNFDTIYELLYEHKVLRKEEQLNKSEEILKNLFHINIATSLSFICNGLIILNYRDFLLSILSLLLGSLYVRDVIKCKLTLNMIEENNNYKIKRKR